MVIEAEVHPLVLICIPEVFYFAKVLFGSVLFLKVPNLNLHVHEVLTVQGSSLVFMT